MKLLLFSAFAFCAILPLAAEAAWFGHTSNYTTDPYDSKYVGGKHTTPVADIEAEHVKSGTKVLPRREHVQQGPDHVTIHKEIPIQTKIVEIPMIRTAVVTATVTATSTAVVTATETAIATETATVTDVKTVHAVHTVLPSVDNYRLNPNEQPKEISEHDHLVYRRCFDITVPKTTTTEEGVMVDKDVAHLSHRHEVKHHNGATAVTGSAIIALIGALSSASFIF